ncbi:hypothetical protein KUH32_11950 [Thalassococcus sp. CAU 1522]|uniref:AAA+ family ATPase n=1 Tax=Thalassococcus arenae TaxID=2851652 RepID=A0ABS6N8Z9_9RHOB|nr:hypothetical protein [Thalassococcus arenae]MBV2360490.1 hypothetical protein [Thalassococcus arenae]
MTRIAAITLAALIAVPASAQDNPEDDGVGLMQRGAQLFFRGLMQEMEPALDELEDLARTMEPALRDFVETMGPALRDLLSEVEDWSVYHPPEMLPNGDIILRRKTEDELRGTPPTDKEEIEL